MRRTCCLALILALILSGFALAEDRRADKSVLSIMTLNAEFLWDGVEPEEGNVVFPWKGSQAEAEEHMRKVAEIVVKSDPDIVNLVEVENKAALDTFNNKFLTGRGYKAYFVQGKDTVTGEDVVLLTRIDPEANAITRDDRKGQSGNTSKSVSKNYVAKVSVGERKIALVGVHLLAFPLMENRRLQREAQAQAIRAIAVDLKGAGYSPVVLGDFNDYDGDDHSLDHIDSVPITNVLRTIRAMVEGDPNDDLVNAAAFMPKAGRYTAFYDANRNGTVDPPTEFTSIDHVLVSPELAAKIEVVEVPHNHDPLSITDHFPVVVRFRLAETPPPSAVKVQIVSLLPNPPGNENENEEVTIQNLGAVPVDMKDWKLKDLSGKIWVLQSLGVLNPNVQKVIKRQGQPMTLNNGGDTIDLLGPNGEIVQTVTYPRVDEGEVVTPAIN